MQQMMVLFAFDGKYLRKTQTQTLSVNKTLNFDGDANADVKCKQRIIWTVFPELCVLRRDLCAFLNNV